MNSYQVNIVMCSETSDQKGQAIIGQPFPYHLDQIQITVKALV